MFLTRLGRSGQKTLKERKAAELDDTGVGVEPGVLAGALLLGVGVAQDIRVLRGELRLYVKSRDIVTGEAGRSTHRSQYQVDVGKQVGRAAQGEGRDDETRLRALGDGLLDHGGEGGQTFFVTEGRRVTVIAVAIGGFEHHHAGVGHRELAGERETTVRLGIRDRADIAREDDVGMGLALHRRHQAQRDAADQVRSRRERVA